MSRRDLLLTLKRTEDKIEDLTKALNEAEDGFNIEQEQMQGRRNSYEPATTTDGWFTGSAANEKGFFIPHGTIGVFRLIRARIRSTDGASASLTLNVAPTAEKEAIISKSFSTSNQTETEVTQYFNTMWLWNSMAVWVTDCDSNCEIAYEDLGWGNGALNTVGSTVTSYHQHIRCQVIVDNVGLVTPITGTVNNIKLPNATAASQLSSALVPASDSRTRTVVEGAGFSRNILICVKDGSVSADSIIIQVKVDGKTATNAYGLSLADFNAFNNAELNNTLQILSYNVPTGEYLVQIPQRIPFQRKLEIYFENPDPNGSIDCFLYSADYELIGQ